MERSLADLLEAWREAERHEAVVLARGATLKQCVAARLATVEARSTYHAAFDREVKGAGTPHESRPPLRNSTYPRIAPTVVRHSRTRQSAAAGRSLVSRAECSAHTHTTR
jgi:hypothetical protein